MIGAPDGEPTRECTGQEQVARLLTAMPDSAAGAVAAAGLATRPSARVAIGGPAGRAAAPGRCSCRRAAARSTRRSMLDRPRLPAPPSIQSTARCWPADRTWHAGRQRARRPRTAHPRRFRGTSPARPPPHEQPCRPRTAYSSPRLPGHQVHDGSRNASTTGALTGGSRQLAANNGARAGTSNGTGTSRQHGPGIGPEDEFGRRRRRDVEVRPRRLRSGGPGGGAPISSAAGARGSRSRPAHD